MTADTTKRFAAPKGTRDFYPTEMAVRRHLESIWRTVSVNHGFEEIDGPTFEHLDLYTVKSGEGIVSELFSFMRAGGDTRYALRPEFTPTLARMVAARAAQLPKPVKWFCMPMFFRAERPQRGRLREFQQWNVDLIGDDSPRADAEVIATCVEALRTMGIASEQITVRFSHRALITEALTTAGVPDEQLDAAMVLLDRRAKMEPAAFSQECKALGLSLPVFDDTLRAVADRVNTAIRSFEAGEAVPPMDDDIAMATLLTLLRSLHDVDVLTWCAFDPTIVRGLAYYTGTVFEVHEATGKERAIAGGGRYDKLVELFGGPPTPAVGFAMGDVVIRLVLEDLGLLDAPENYLPRPDVFVISTGLEEAEAAQPSLITSLRRAGLHVRQSYRATKNIGKLLGDAGKARARFAVILGNELTEGRVVVKHLDSGDQSTIALADLESTLSQRPADDPD